MPTLRTPTRQTSEADLNEWNVRLRSSPVYLEFLRANGIDPNGRVKLSRGQQGALEDRLREAGTPVPRGMHIDQGGNLNQKNRTGRNLAIAGGVAGAALAPFVLPALIGGGAAGGGAAAAGGGAAGAGGGLLAATPTVGAIGSLAPALTGASGLTASLAGGGAAAGGLLAATPTVGAIGSLAPALTGAPGLTAGGFAGPALSGGSRLRNIGKIFNSPTGQMLTQTGLRGLEKAFERRDPLETASTTTTSTKFGPGMDELSSRLRQSMDSVGSARLPDYSNVPRGTPEDLDKMREQLKLLGLS